MITQAKLSRWGACYTDEELAAIWRRLRLPEEVSALRVARARSISVEDRLWVLLRPEVLGDLLHAVLGPIVDRAVMHAADALDAVGVAHGLRDLPKASPETYGQIKADVWAARDVARAAARAARAARAASAVAWAARAAVGAASAAAWDAERRWQLAHITRVLREAAS